MISSRLFRYLSCFLFFSEQQLQTGIAESGTAFRLFVDPLRAFGQRIHPEPVIAGGNKFHGTPKLGLHALRNDIALSDLLFKKGHQLCIQGGAELPASFAGDEQMQGFPMLLQKIEKQAAHISGLHFLRGYGIHEPLQGQQDIPFHVLHQVKNIPVMVIEGGPVDLAEVADGTNTVTAASGEVKGNTITLNALPEPDASYVRPVGKDDIPAGNWFDGLGVGTDDDHMEFPEGFYSVKDTVADVYKLRDGKLIVELLANVGAFGPITAIRTMQPPLPLDEFIHMVGALPAGGMSYINAELNKIPKA